VVSSQPQVGSFSTQLSRERPHVSRWDELFFSPYYLTELTDDFDPLFQSPFAAVVDRSKAFLRTRP